MELTIPVNPFRTHGGVKAPHRKHTAQSPSVVMPPPQQVVIPMSMHIGAPCTPLVKVGAEVLVGQKIGEGKGFVSAPIHASVSGKVKAVGKVTLGTGQSVDAITIESDGQMTISPDVHPPEIHSKEDFLNAVKESGLVGLGGAGFPTHVKHASKDALDTLIINGAECEPYLTSDNREALEEGEHILDGIFAVMHWLGIQRTIIGIEGNKPQAIQHLKDLIAKDSRSNGKVGVLTLKARYPQGAEKVLIKAATDRVVPMGKLPSSVGCVVMNITSVGFLGRYLESGMPLISKRITVDGSAITNPQNVIAPIGSKISDLVAFCGGYKGEPKKILYGGPMMGNASFTDDSPILKQTNGILALNEKESRLPRSTACIHCGACLTVCPMNLMPSMFEKYTEFKKVDELRDIAVLNCIECGCCSYTCPAKRPLVQAIRIGKSMVRKADAEAKAKAEAKKEN
ncbi:MAG: electron transport complex subunit RsxC [Oscillospiraceae bacterium]|nr:electron transport complex subunit RsxC [Oscillospiraceae bacterium]